MSQTGSRTRPITRIALATLVACAAAAALGAASAPAANYTAKFCVQGSGPEKDKGPFERSGNETVYGISNNCGNANGLRVSHNAGQAATGGAFGRWLAERPDGITVSRIDYKAKGADQSGGYVAQVIGAGPGGALEIVNGGQQLAGDFAGYSVSGDTKRFGVQLICNPNTSACSATPPSNPEVALKDVTYTLDDPTAPVVTVTDGSLFEASVQSGAQTIGFNATDGGSGVARVVAVVNGVDAGQAAAKCASSSGSALGFTPCPAAFSGAVGVNTAAAPWRDGRNKVKTCVEDFAGTRTCTKQRQVRVLNGCVGNGPPANAGQTMELGWPGKKGVVRSRQGRARKATARLFGPGRVPLAGAAICFSRGIPTDKKRAERVIAAGAVTGPDGRVQVKVRGQSSRVVYATYWAGPETVIAKRIRLEVSPAIRLELRAPKHPEAGDKLRVVALLRGKYKADRKVCFYVTRHGRDKFACDQTGRGGRARVGYKAEDPGKLVFYAKVPNQHDYPYTRGHSAKKKLHID